MSGLVILKGGTPAVINGTVAAATASQVHWGNSNSMPNPTGRYITATASYVRTENTGVADLVLRVRQTDAEGATPVALQVAI